MTKKQLEKQISKKLEKLAEILEEIRNFDIQPNDPDMWDPDYYYDLVSQLEQASELLKDKKSPRAVSDFSEPLVLETGLCSLLDEYHEEDEDDEY